MLRKHLFANPAGPPGTDGLTGELACYFTPVIRRGPLQLHTLAHGLVSRDSFLLSGYALQPSIPDSGALRFLKKKTVLVGISQRYWAMAMDTAHAI